MRYEISDYEWTAIKPMLPNKPRGIRRVTTVACSMAPFGFCVQVRRGATCQRPMAPVPRYNRFVRLAFWNQIMDALAAGACPRWVGDFHQPLHVSFEDDRGGNSVLVSELCGPNLHSAWDTCLVLKAVGEDVGEAATELLKTITPARIESWNHSNPMDWANESFAIAEQAQTKYCIRQGASCNHPAGKVNIDAAYVAVNTPIIREQLQKAGVRLAHLLDAALGK